MMAHGLGATDNRALQNELLSVWLEGDGMNLEMPTRTAMMGITHNSSGRALARLHS